MSKTLSLSDARQIDALAVPVNLKKKIPSNVPQFKEQSMEQQ